MTWDKHKNIIIFLLITLMGIILYLYDKDGLGWKVVNIIGIATTLSLSGLAFMAYLDYAKGEDTIRIYFKTEKIPKIYTKLYTQRKHFTRGEAMGLLGMIYNGEGRFNLSDFNKNTEILKRFQAIQNGNADELIIVTDEKELKQFNILA